jgi:hypothetical protein
MSEYQYYEFQAIDRPLTDEEQQAVARLSSRVDPHPRQAVFVYNYGDFRGDPAKILTQYYDAMLYLTNWGSRQLMLRFPRSVLDLEGARAYCQPPIVEDYFSLSTVGEYAILNIEFHDEEGGDWVEGEGWLPAMIGVRDDILQGDYRSLYLAWLKTLEFEELLDSVIEPPVPPGLGKLTPALRSLVEFFGIDEMLVQVAAKASSDRQAVADDWLRGALARLAVDERDAFLVRLAQGEPYLSVALNQRLREIAPLPQATLPPRRTVGQLLADAEEHREREHQRRAAEAEAKRIRELETLAKREAETWAEVESLIDQMQAKPYDEAVQLLVKLRDLAVYQGEEAIFHQRLNGIYEQYRRRSGLVGRLRGAGLLAS